MERLERALLALRRVDLKLVETQTLPIDAEPSRVAMSAEFLDCLARPPVVHASGQAARLDPRAMAWIPVLVAATSKCTVEKGLHVAVRTADGYDADRLLVDLAERVAEAGATTWAPVCGAGCAWQIVRAELHTATRPRVVAMRNARLFEEPASWPRAMRLGRTCGSVRGPAVREPRLSFSSPPSHRCATCTSGRYRRECCRPTWPR